MNNYQKMSVDMAEAIGRCSAYSYCMRQITSLLYGPVDRVDMLLQLHTQIEKRYMEAMDDMQAIAAENPKGMEAEYYE